MCRGCILTMGTKSEDISVGDYLKDILYPYEQMTQEMKSLEKVMDSFENKVNKKHRQTFSKFRRKLIRLRREWSNAHTVLDEIYVTKEEE